LCSIAGILTVLGIFIIRICNPLPEVVRLLCENVPDKVAFPHKGPIIGQTLYVLEGGTSLSAQFADAVDDHGSANLACTSEPLQGAEAFGTKLDAADPPLWLAASRKRRRLGPQLKLSIIMAVYNEQDTIEQAVGEVLEVEYPCDMELIGTLPGNCRPFRNTEWFLMCNSKALNRVKAVCFTG